MTELRKALEEIRWFIHDCTISEGRTKALATIDAILSSTPSQGEWNEAIETAAVVADCYSIIPKAKDRKGIAGPRAKAIAIAIRSLSRQPNATGGAGATIKEPFLPVKLEDSADDADPRAWNADALEELARQLGVMNDYYYPLIGAASMLASSTAPVAGVVVAWRVKDFAEGWFFTHDLKIAEAQREKTGAYIEPLYASTAPVAGVAVLSKEQIKHMVDRFLGWKLPKNFNPDAGISFKASFNEHTAYPMKNEPSGTNLFDATQAEAMVRYMIEGLPLAAAPAAQGDK